jgi:hypothetical protein
VPTAWKQWLVTWSAILPLSIVVPWVVAPVIAHLGFAHDSFMNKAAVTAAIVFLMAYVVMPRYTRLVAPIQVTIANSARCSGGQATPSSSHREHRIPLGYRHTLKAASLGSMA